MKKGILFIGLAGFILAGSGCTNSGMFGIRGEGPVVERKLTLRQISGITVPGSAHVYLTQGPEQEIVVEGQENIIDNLRKEVNADIWEIGNKAPVWQSQPLKIRITLKELRLVKVSGSADVETTNHFSGGKDLDIKISGSGSVKLDIDAGDISAVISGSGSIRMEGTAEDLDLGVSGSGDIMASGLKSSRADIRVSGAGNVEIDAEKSIDAHISGSGNVFYKGSPSVNSSVSGSGSIRQR